MQMSVTHGRLSSGEGAFDLDALVAARSTVCVFAPIVVKWVADTLHASGALAAARAGDTTDAEVGAVS